MKIFTLAPREDWIVDRLVSEWKKTFPQYNVEDPRDADILWLLAGWCWNHLPMELLRQKKVIMTIHHIVPEKFDQKKFENFMFADMFVNCYHVPNEKTKQHLQQITKKPIHVVSYWYYPDHWKIIERNKAKETLGINSERFCITSIQRDTEGFDLKTPKLEKGPDIFCDFVEKNISKFDNPIVLLGGWRRQYVSNRLKNAKIEYILMEKQPIEKINLMYCASDLYVVSSRFEGGPQSVLEAGGLKVPIISTDVGIAKNVLSKNCVFDVSKSFYIPSNEDIEENYKKVKDLSIEKQGLSYLKVFKGMI